MKLKTPSTDRKQFRKEINILTILVFILLTISVYQSSENEKLRKLIDNNNNPNDALVKTAEELSLLNSYLEEDFGELAQRFALLGSDFNDLAIEKEELQNRIFELIGDNSDLTSLLSLLFNPTTSGISIKDHFDILIKFLNEPGLDTRIKEQLKYNLITSYLSRVVNIGYKDKLGTNHESNLFGVRSGEYVKSLTGALTFEYASGDTERSIELNEGSTFEEAKQNLILMASDLTSLSNGLLKFDVHVSDFDEMKNLFLTLDINGVSTMVLHIVYITNSQIYSIHTQNISIYDITEQDRRYDNNSDIEPYHYDGSAYHSEIIEA